MLATLFSREKRADFGWGGFLDLRFGLYPAHQIPIRGCFVISAAVGRRSGLGSIMLLIIFCSTNDAAPKDTAEKSPLRSLCQSSPKCGKTTLAASSRVMMPRLRNKMTGVSLAKMAHQGRHKPKNIGGLPII